MRFVWLAPVAVALLGCGQRTEIVVGVSTNLEVPAAFDGVLLDVIDDTGARLVHQPVTLAGVVRLPATVGLSPSGDPARSFVIAVTATVGGNAVVTRKVRLHFLAGRTLFLRVPLSTACRGQLEGACPDGRWCAGGSCAPIELDPASLPDYHAGDEAVAECGSDYASFGLGAPALRACATTAACVDSTCVAGATAVDLAAPTDGVLPTGDLSATDAATGPDDAAVPDAPMSDDGSRLDAALLADTSTVEDGAIVADLAADLSGVAPLDATALFDAAAPSDATALFDATSPPDGTVPRDLAGVDFAPALLAPAAHYGAGGKFPQALALADLTGDGILDAVTYTSIYTRGNFLSVAPGSVGGRFDIAKVSPATEPNLNTIGNAVNAIAAGDFDGDGKLDLVLGASSDPSFGNAGGYLYLHLGNGDGTVRDYVRTPALGSARHIYGVATGDLDGDGKVDIVAGGVGVSQAVYVLLGLGNGSFAPVASYSTASQINVPHEIVLVDMDRDGKLDVVCNDGAGITVFLGRGNGQLKPGQATSASSLFYGGGLAVGDIDGDGKLDAVTVSSLNNNQFGLNAFLGNGDGTARAVAQPNRFTAQVSSLALGDFNHDGKLDLVTPLPGMGNFDQIGVHLGAGNGSFAEPQYFYTGKTPFLVTRDLDGDGKTDVLTLDEGSATLSVLRGIAP